MVYSQHIVFECRIHQNHPRQNSFNSILPETDETKKPNTVTCSKPIKINKPSKKWVFSFDTGFN